MSRAGFTIPHLLITTVLLVLPISLFAQQPPSSTSTAAAKGASSATTPAATTLPGAHPPASLLGMTLKQAFAEFGAPEQVFPVRGKQAWEDDVVFYYPDHSYLFWFRDRIWQVRVDRRFSGAVLGVKMGEDPQAIQKALGKPFHTGKDSEIFILPDRGYPVRARLFFTKGQLSDLYVYRGDF